MPKNPYSAERQVAARKNPLGRETEGVSAGKPLRIGPSPQGREVDPKSPKNRQCQPQIILISGDSDLEPAVEWIRKRHPEIKVTVYIPQDSNDPKARRNDTYRQMGVDAKPLPTGDLRRSQFPHKVDLGSGRVVERPKEWK